MTEALPEKTTDYLGEITDTKRWASYKPRPGDILICTPPKCGTTWTQSIFTLLTFGADTDVKPSDVSPWFDAQFIPLDAATEMIEKQTHQRFVKTHSPLDGVPYFKDCTYITVYRDLRDLHSSLRNHVFNMGNDMFAEGVLDDINEDFRNFCNAPMIPGQGENRSVAFYVHHYLTYKSFAHLPNVHMFHYADMKRDLPGAISRMATAAVMKKTPEEISAIADALTFEKMREKSDQFTPGGGNGFWKNDKDFFKKGVNGQWRDVLTDDDLALFDARMADLLPPEDIAWLAKGGALPMP
jgi:aryl sulfotransferase